MATTDQIVESFNETVVRIAQDQNAQDAQINSKLSADFSGVIPSTARDALGLGDSATKNVGTTADTVAAGNDPRIADALTKSNNLAGLTNVPTARSNLGLQSMAQQAASAVAITGGTIAGITDLAIADGGTGSSTASGARTSLGAFAGGFGSAPLVGGSGGVIDLGSYASHFLNIGGSVVQITSFGSSASTSEPVYWVRFSSPHALVPSANLIIRSNTIFGTTAGDVAAFAYEGSGVWRMIAYYDSATTNSGRTFLAASGYAAMRNLLSLGGAALLNVGTASGTVMAGDDSRVTALGPRGGANGYVPLNSGAKIDSAYLPVNGSYKGAWNASTNTPTITSGVGVSGDFYIVNVAGSTNIDGITSWSVGDQIRFSGTVWQKIASSNAVASVNGQTGAVVLTKSDVGLGNVDNTSDANKPISTATQTALDLKAAAGANSDITSLSGLTTAITIAQGGTGATTAANARTALGVAIGTDVLAYDATLQNLAGVTTAANKGLYWTGVDTAATYDLSAAGRALANSTGTANSFLYFSALNTPSNAPISAAGLAILDDIDAAAQRTTLGLGSIATQDASNVSITGGTIANVTLTNPSGLTKATVGLGNVDNTSDMDKPVSTAQAAAIASGGTSGSISPQSAGIPTSGNVTTQMQNLINSLSAANKALDLRKSASYTITTLTIPDGFCMIGTGGVFRHLNALGDLGKVINLGKNLNIEALRVSSPATSSVDNINIDGDITGSRIGLIEVVSDGENLGHAAYIRGSNVYIGEIRVRNVRYGFNIGEEGLATKYSGMHIEKFSHDTYRRAVFFGSYTDSYIGEIVATTRHSNAGNTPGNNTLLTAGLENCHFGRIISEDAGEHGVRLSGGMQKNLTFGPVTVLRSQGCAIKLNPGNAPDEMRNIYVESLYFEDIGTEGQSGGNSEAIRINSSYNVFFGSVIGRANTLPYSVSIALTVNDVSGLTIDNYDVENVHYSGFEVHTRNDSATQGTFATNINFNRMRVSSDGPAALISFNTQGTPYTYGPVTIRGLDASGSYAKFMSKVLTSGGVPYNTTGVVPITGWFRVEGRVADTSSLDCQGLSPTGTAVNFDIITTGKQYVGNPTNWGTITGLGTSGATGGYDLANGDIRVRNGSLLMVNTKVVGTRRTGWGAPTGTANRAAFATSTVSLENLAQRVKALIDDLTTHGLIGS